LAGPDDYGGLAFETRFNTLRANMVSSRLGVAQGPSFTDSPLEEGGFELVVPL